jgi:hypothetical protein
MKADALKNVDFHQCLKFCYEDLEPYLLAELEQLREGLAALPEGASKKKILSLFEKCVVALNELDESEVLESGIDTVEREALCEALYRLGDVVGLDASTEYVDEWRDW